MINIVGVKVKNNELIFYTAIDNNLQIKINDSVIIETDEGYDFANVVTKIKTVDEKENLINLVKFVRIATKVDEEHFEDNIKKAKKAYKVCLEKIVVHGLKMKLVDVEYKFDNSKIVFYFTAEGRIDFRELVKDLAAIYKMRIELRQIGIRDEVKRIGGNGICGRELCCCSFLKNFDTVSIKMAKEQNLVLNPSKITGNCGRLMCCLRYEQDVYDEKISRLPKCGAIVKTEDGEGEVCLVETLSERVKVKLDNGEEIVYKKYNFKDIKVIKDFCNKEEDNFDDVKEDELEELEKLEKLEDENF